MESSVKKVFSVSNYRFYFAGQTLSLIGSWMQSTAMSWLVWRLTGSASMLGVIGFMNMLPSLFFGYPAGVVADRIELKKGLYITQISAMLLAFAVAFLTLFDAVKIWHIIIVGVMLGITGSFDMTFRQSFVIQIVPREVLHTAIALNSVMFNLSRIIGPAIAGFVVKYYSEGYCFLANALSYSAIIFALFKIKPFTLKKEEKKDFLKSFSDGISYIKNTPYIKFPILHMFLLSFIMMPVITLMPVYVNRFEGDAGMLGFFMSFIGLGAMMGGLSLASKSRAKQYSKMVNTFSTLYGFSLFLLAFSKSFYFSAVLLLVAGIGTARQAIGINTIIQSLVYENMRGRVLSVYSISFIGLSPFGNLIWGSVTQKYGIKTTLIICSLWVFVSNFIFYKNMMAIKTNKRLHIENCEFFEVL